MTAFTATALVTGGTSGLGLATARLLAKQRPDWQVLLAARSSNGDVAATVNEALRKADPSRRPNVFFLPLDCSSLAAVRRFVAAYAGASHPPLRALLLNAGVQIVGGGVQYSADGYERTFATNHLGQALLFFQLRPYLAADAHIVITGSGLEKRATYESAERCAHPNEYPGWEAGREGRKRYALSKLVNTIWFRALRRRAQQAGQTWTVAAFSPGLIPGTGLARDAPAIQRFLWRYVLPYMLPLLRRLIPDTYAVDEPASVLARLAVEDGLVSGADTAYWRPNGPAQSSEASNDRQKQDDLWQWTVQAVATDEAERERYNALR